MFLENKTVDERISRAIDNDHTAAMKAPSGDRKHMKKKSASFGSPPEMVTVCMLCKKAFKNALVYRKHLRIHSDKAFICNICGKPFGKKHYLQAHMQIHGKNQYQCHLCHKRFTQKGNLNQHLKFHNSKKAFKCNICEKDFYQQEHLKTHLRHHNNERPFECEICRKSFNIKSSLQRHMNCHTGEKPFICDICNRGYTRRSVLMLHIQQVHENKKPFECDECHLCFSQKGNLQAHFRRKHLQPKSDGKRGNKDGSKGKRSMKRQHSRPGSKTIKICTNKNYHIDSSSDDQSSNKMNKPRLDNASLHSYACKVKAIVNRGSKAQQAFSTEEIQFIKSPSKSVTSLEHGSKVYGQSSTYSEKLNLVSFDTSSSCSLSDEAADVGCSSSSSDDIPELYPTFLENHSDVAYDKPLTDFDTLLTDNKSWDEYLLTETDNILSSTLPHYDMNEILSSPSKSSIILTKACADITDELFNNSSWNDDYANPLFTADDLDEIKDISGAWILNQNGVEIKKEVPDTYRSQCNNQNSKGINLNLSVQKLSFTESSVHA